MAVHQAVAGDVLMVSYFVVSFSHKMSWMRSVSEMSVPDNFPTYFSINKMI